MNDKLFKGILFVICSIILSWGIFSGLKYHADLNRFESNVETSTGRGGVYSRTYIFDKMTGEKTYK